MRLEVPGSDGSPVRADVVGPAHAPAVLVLHGFKGFRDWGMFPWISERIAASGLRAVRLDFSHNGVGEAGGARGGFDRLDLFCLDTWTRHQDDLDAVLSRLDGPIGLVGHSRGGGDALLLAARTPRVRCVATLASVASTTDLEPVDLEAVLRREGVYPVKNARTGQTMPIARSAFDDARRYSIEAAARSVDRPLLLVHGTADGSVPISHQERLASWASHATTLRVEGAGHTFGAVHPFEGPTPHLEQAVAAVTTFLSTHLAR